MITTSFAVTALPAVALAGPVIPRSTAQTTFTAVSPGTPEGLARLRAAFDGGDRDDRRAFFWEANTQAFIESPALPTGGLLPSQGWFVATRSAVTLDFSGSPVPAPAMLALQPGWNFIGIPPVDDDGITQRVHLIDDAAGDDFTLVSATGAVLSGADRTAALGTGAWWWDGAAYQRVSVLDSGRGYWLRNRLDEVVFLSRQSGSPRDAQAVVRTRAAKLGEDTPPPPPGGGKQADANPVPAADGGSGCGLGSGLAGLILALALVLRLGWLRPGRAISRFS